jgi:hypothetical protein
MMTAITFWRKSVSCAKIALSQFNGAVLSIKALCRKLGHISAWPPNEEIFQDFPIVCGGEGLFANLTLNQVIYNL